MNRDLTEGKAESVLWKFCLPLFGSVLNTCFKISAGSTYLEDRENTKIH